MLAPHTACQTPAMPGSDAASTPLERLLATESLSPPPAAESDRIREVMAALLRISLDDMPLHAQLGDMLDHLLAIPWLALESKGAVFLVEGQEDVLTLAAHRNLAEPLLTACAKVPFGHCLCGRAAASATVEHADCVDHRHDVRYEGMVPHGHYVVPIVLHGRVLGVMALYLPPGHIRNTPQEQILRTIADLLAGILAHRQTQRNLETAVGRLRKTLGTTIQAMGTALETRDPYTAGHQHRVADLSRAIATTMELPADQVEAVRTAATIHDIGKISVPAEILTKPGRLNDVEFELVKAHARIGYNILRNIDFAWPVAQMVLQHHERLDGSGYPAGLSGADILQEARILAVADVVEAMMTHRPYRPAPGLDAALREIAGGAGKVYDATVARACQRLFDEKGFSI